MINFFMLNAHSGTTTPSVKFFALKVRAALVCSAYVRAALGFAGNAFAWGAQGHQVIASVALSMLTPVARKEVDRLLAQEPGATLASISTWADEHRNPATSAWHYVNFPRDSCSYDVVRDCPDGKCVVAAIERQTAILKSNVSAEQRLIALKYLVHFVADVHQPLHAGYLDDKGGNTYQLQAFMRGSNLHALWDSGLIHNMQLNNDALVERLIKSSGAISYPELNPSIAAEESCKIVGDPEFYPTRRVGMDYIQKFTPILEGRLRLAGARLAGILNKILQ